MDFHESFFLSKEELTGMSVNELEAKISNLQNLLLSKEKMQMEMDRKCQNVNIEIDHNEHKIKQINKAIEKIINNNAKKRNKKSEIFKKYQMINKQISDIAKDIKSSNFNNDNIDSLDLDPTKLKQKCDKLMIKYRSLTQKLNGYNGNNLNQSEIVFDNDNDQLCSLLNEESETLALLFTHWIEYSNNYSLFVNKSQNFQIYNQLIYLLKQILFRKKQNLKRQETLMNSNQESEKTSNINTNTNNKRLEKKQQLNEKIKNINVELEALKSNENKNEMNQNIESFELLKRKNSAIDRLIEYLQPLQAQGCENSVSKSLLKHNIDIYDDFDLIRMDTIPIFDTDVANCLKALQNAKKSVESQLV